MTPNAVLERLRELVLGNLAYKLLAGAFAMMMWIWVQSEQVVEERTRVRLDWKFPEGLTPVEPPLETATVTVEGVQAFVRAVRQRELAIPVDLSRAKEGPVELDLSERSIAGLPGHIRVVSVSPATLQLRLDRIQKRRVPVAAATRGEPAEGWRVAGVRVQPDRVELRGPSTVLRQLEEVQTDPVDVAGLREDGEFTVGLAVRQGQLAPTSPVTFTVTVDLEPVVKQRRFEDVPVLVRTEGWVATAETVGVTLQGPSATIDEIDPDEVSVVVLVPDGYAPEAGLATRTRGAGPRYEVVHPGGDPVEVVDVQPQKIPVIRP